MGENSDDLQNYALAVLAGVVALVIAGVIALAAATSMVPSAGPPPAATAEAADAAGLPAQPSVERIYFEVDADTLPAEAAEVLTRVADAARANLNAVVLISGYHDSSGGAEHNAELARRRAEAVHHGLLANGVSPIQLVFDKPRETTGGDDARAARRVELRVQ